MQEVVLALLAKEPSHGYELRARLQDALGPLAEAMNAGQIYVTLGRLEKAGLATVQPAAGQGERADRKVYALTADGQQRLADWLADVAAASAPRRRAASWRPRLTGAATASCRTTTATTAS
jgi:DNA-binding PadR family transcriptional regulator